MKSKKVQEIIRENKIKSLAMCRDYSMAQFSYDEVVNLVKMSNEELGFEKNHNLASCYILLDYLEKNVRLIDFSRFFFPDEVTAIVEVTELDDENYVKDSIKSFKEKHK